MPALTGPRIKDTEQTRCKYGYKRDDIVITPTRRRAKLTKLRSDDMWDAVYLDAPQFQSADQVTLNPKFLKPE